MIDQGITSYVCTALTRMVSRMHHFSSVSSCYATRRIAAQAPMAHAVTVTRMLICQKMYIRSLILELDKIFSENANDIA